MSPLIATASPVALRPATGLPAFALLISCWKRVFDCCVWAKQPRAGDTQRRARIAVLIVCMIASFCSCCCFDNKSTKNIRVTTRSHPLFCKSKGSDGQNKGSKRQSKGSKRQKQASKRQKQGKQRAKQGKQRAKQGKQKAKQGKQRQLPPCGCPLAVAANMRQKFLGHICPSLSPPSRHRPHVPFALAITHAMRLSAKNW